MFYLIGFNFLIHKHQVTFRLSASNVRITSSYFIVFLISRSNTVAQYSLGQPNLIGDVYPLLSSSYTNDSFAV